MKYEKLGFKKVENDELYYDVYDLIEVIKSPLIFSKKEIKMKFERIEVNGVEPAIRGIRNSYQSWENSDSMYVDKFFTIGEKDTELIKKLIKAGPSHRKFLRMINIYVDITGPEYWWKQFDTYKIGTVANSTSTMHSIMKKEFEITDFTNYYPTEYHFLMQIIDMLNETRSRYLESMNQNERDKLWEAIIRTIPFSYNYKRTVMFSMEVARIIIDQRKGHRLKEWKEFINFLNHLPYSKVFLEDQNGT